MSAINRGRFLPRFPASVQSTGPIITTQAALSYTFSFDLRGLGTESSSIDRAAHVTLVQNSTTGSFSQIALDDLLSGNQPLDATLTALAALDSSTGLLEQTGADAFTKRAMGTGASTSIPTIADADGRYQPIDAGLTAVAALASAGLVARTGAGTAAARTIAGTSGRVTVTNGDGASGDPTIDWSGVQVRKNSTGSTFTRRRVNLIEGGNVTLTVSDDAGNDEVDVTIASSGSGATLPLMYVSGFTLANNATDATNDIDVAAGAARDDTNVLDLSNTSTVVKQLDVSFAEYTLPGTASGGRDSTTNLTGAKWFNVFVIGGSGKNSQPFFATSASPTLPSGFTAKRRVGSIYWDGSAIRAFSQAGDIFTWNTVALDLNSTTITTSAAATTLLVPPLAGIIAIVQGLCSHATLLPGIYVYRTGQTTNANAPTGRVIGAFLCGYGTTVVVDGSGQVQVKSDQSATTVTVGTVGWRDPRGV